MVISTKRAEHQGRYVHVPLPSSAGVHPRPSPRRERAARPSPYRSSRRFPPGIRPGGELAAPPAEALRRKVPPRKPAHRSPLVNVTLLIDAVVRQTTVLIAELATSGGLRAPLAHLANQVFVDLAAELHAQGLSRKVGADMFGMALRTYQRKVQRLQESRTERGRSLWEAVYDHVRAHELVDRRAVLVAFVREDEAVVRGVLHDLVESGLVFATGSAQDTSFRAATAMELNHMAKGKARDMDELVWALVFRTGPTTASALTELGGLERAAVVASLERLTMTGRIERADGATDEATYSTGGFHIPLGTPSGWEAAVFDHYHAVVRTICAKLRQSGGRSSAADVVGGSTYSLEVWAGHPFEERVLSSLQRFRTEFSELRKLVREHNERSELPPERRRVIIYGGQCTWEEQDGDADV